MLPVPLLRWDGLHLVVGLRTVVVHLERLLRRGGMVSQHNLEGRDDTVRGLPTVSRKGMSSRVSVDLSENRLRWRSVMEAQPVLMDAEAHDTQLAWTSHLPQAMASALARVVGQEPALRGVTWGSGIRDSTRIAASPPEAWVDILMLNRAAVLEATQAFQAQVGELHGILASGDRERLRIWLEGASTIRRGVERVASAAETVVTPPDDR